MSLSPDHWSRLDQHQFDVNVSSWCLTPMVFPRRIRTWHFFTIEVAGVLKPMRRLLGVAIALAAKGRAIWIGYPSSRSFRSPAQSFEYQLALTRGSRSSQIHCS